MRGSGRRLLLALVAISLLTAIPAPAAAQGAEYRTGFVRWRAASQAFEAWQRSAVLITALGALELDPQQARPEQDPYPAQSYHGGNFYNGSGYLVGEALSPHMPAGFAFTQAVASWNAETPAGSWIETQIRVQRGQRWTAWYSLGIWAADESTVRRHSVPQQRDADGRVAVDTLLLAEDQPPAEAYQLKLRLFSLPGGAPPQVRNLALALSTAPEPGSSPGDPGLWDRRLAVPVCSQMVYPDGGEDWCSPTSLAMVLAFWQQASAPCEPRVRDAVARVYDWIYDGYGNWSFNVAAAASQGLEGYVARFSSMAQAEEWIAAGVPILISFGWEQGQLSGAPIPASEGHIAVLVGFDAAGNPVVNEPAGASDQAVQRVYPRAELENLWLAHSGGTAYLIHPADWTTPGALTSDLPPMLALIKLRVQDLLRSRLPQL